MISTVLLLASVIPGQCQMPVQQYYWECQPTTYCPVIVPYYYYQQSCPPPPQQQQQQQAGGIRKSNPEVEKIVPKPKAQISPFYHETKLASKKEIKPKLVCSGEITSIIYVNVLLPNGGKQRVPIANGILPTIKMFYVNDVLDNHEFFFPDQGQKFTGNANDEMKYKKGLPYVTAGEGRGEGDTITKTFSAVEYVPVQIEETALKRPSQMKK